MRSGRKISTSAVTRRGFLKRVGAAAAAAGLAPAVSSPFVSTALAQTKTLKILQWSHFVPQYDNWFDGFAKDWGKKNGITVTVDHIPHLELPARAAAEVSAGAGHDLFCLQRLGRAAPVRKTCASISAASSASWRRSTARCSRSVARSPTTRVRKAWSAFPDYYIRFPGLYRKDLWDEIGMKPDTWEDIRVGGAKLKAKGYPDWHRAWALGRPERLVPQHVVELRRV